VRCAVGPEVFIFRRRDELTEARVRSSQLYPNLSQVPALLRVTRASGACTRTRCSLQIISFRFAGAGQFDLLRTVAGVVGDGQ
jgi:hypothetical protein